MGGLAKHMKEAGLITQKLAALGKSWTVFSPSSHLGANFLALLFKILWTEFSRSTYGNFRRKECLPSLNPTIGNCFVVSGSQPITFSLVTDCCISLYQDSNTGIWRNLCTSRHVEMIGDPAYTVTFYMVLLLSYDRLKKKCTTYFFEVGFNEILFLAKIPA